MGMARKTKVMMLLLVVLRIYWFVAGKLWKWSFIYFFYKHLKDRMPKMELSEAMMRFWSVSCATSDSVQFLVTCKCWYLHSSLRSSTSQGCGSTVSLKCVLRDLNCWEINGLFVCDSGLSEQKSVSLDLGIKLYQVNNTVQAETKLSAQPCQSYM